MNPAIAPPASFGLISGTAFASASPAALAKILDSLDLASLEQEHSRLQRAIQQLQQSNKEIKEFIELEQQELQEHHQQHGGTEAGDTETSSYEPDPEFMLAIEENEAVIAKYERICEQLMSAIQSKRGATTAESGSAGQQEPAGSTDATVENEPAEEGIYL
ncbi:hypothetical protein BC939DRAFT_478217 [Gamsiella multidivaricata]|uniref:uncharacterized protein n=1 Tax=Gamsiella multidivaricata TaxID=101098 RepID=UPI00221F38B5|nr:uncharacterized protein BC939DRAFT_478217 [Gamsiella multidivaricata]KAG0357498.1 hypothetical protein BGZ54_000321 [Gamsiella multidivaricata]KAI7821770.1 hypothetical protein BC939DRAFT_478217 [Gamsiella multidivaricata]